jgi:hypothetical protein
MAVKFSIPGLLTALVLGLIILAQPYGAEPVPAGAEDSRSKLRNRYLAKQLEILSSTRVDQRCAVPP